MKNFIKILSIFYFLFLTTNPNLYTAEKTNHKKIKETWCFHQKTTHNGKITKNQTTCFNVSEKALKNAINRLKKLYDTQQSTFIELSTKCITPVNPLSPRGIKILQKYHIANMKGEIYNCYQKLVPLVFKITCVNPPKSRFVGFEELVKTGAITKQKKQSKTKESSKQKTFNGNSSSNSDDEIKNVKKD